MKADWLKHTRRNREYEPKPVSPPPPERIGKLLDAFEKGDLNAWWHLHLELTLEPLSTRYGDEFNLDLTSLPGWQSADPRTRARIIAAAKTFVARENDHRKQWLGTDTFYRPAAAGYRALVLLQNEEPHYVEELGQEIWSKWAGSIVTFTRWNGNDEKSPQQLLSLAYKAAPAAMIRVLLWIIDSENQRGEYVHVIDRFEGCWDEELGKAVLNKARDLDLKPSSTRDLLNQLLRHRIAGSEELALEMVRSGVGGNDVIWERARIAATALLLHAPKETWHELSPFILNNDVFGKAVIEAAAHSPLERRRGQTVRQLDEEALADLYILLERLFPVATDPKHEGAYFVGPREAVSEFREQVLRELQERGTAESRRQFERLVETLKHVSWLKWALVYAKQRTLEMTWVPPKPAEVLRLAENRDWRLVESPAQLLQVIKESLGRLNVTLQGETPAAPDCWNERRPKDEEAISNYIKAPS